MQIHYKDNNSIIHIKIYTHYTPLTASNFFITELNDMFWNQEWNSMPPLICDHHNHLSLFKILPMNKGIMYYASN